MSREFFKFLNFKFLNLIPSWIYLVLFAIYVIVDKVHAIDRCIEIYHKRKASYSIRSDKKYIAKNIQRRVNQAIGKIRMNVPGIISYSLKVKWATDDPQNTLDTLVREDRVIVKMHRGKDQNENIANIVGEYVRQVSIPKIRWALSNEIQQPMDLKISQKLLKVSELSSAFQYFQTSILEPLLKDQPKVREYFERIENIDLRSLFIPIFVYELHRLEQMVLPTSLYFKRILEDEIIKFLDFLNNMVTAELHKRVELNFLGNEIKIGIMLIAKEETFLKGYRTYVSIFQNLLKRDTRRIYITGLDPFTEFIEFLGNRVKKRFKNEVIKIFQIYCDAFDRWGKLRKTALILFEKKDQGLHAGQADRYS